MVPRPMSRMRWFVRGDVDGFFGLALDNLVQLLLIDALCRRCSASRRARLRPHPARGRGVAPRRQPFLRLAGHGDSGAPPGRTTSARCPTASTPCRSSHTSSWSCCRRSSRPRPRARPTRPASRGRRARRLLRLGRSSSSLGARSPSASAGSTPRAALLSTLAGIALGLHRARLPLPHLSPGRSSACHAGDRPARLLRPRPLPRRAARRPRRRRRSARLLAWITGSPRRRRPPRRLRFTLPVPVFGDLVDGARRRLPGRYLSVILADGALQPRRLAAEHRVRRGGGRPYPTRRRWR